MKYYLAGIVPTFLFSISFCQNQQEWTSDDNKTTNATKTKIPDLLNEIDGISYRYQVQLELKTNRIEEPLEEIEKRLKGLVEKSFMLAMYKHRKQIPPADFIPTRTDYTVKIIKKRVLGELTYLHFVCYTNNQLVIGEIIADDLNHLSAAEISAELHYPLKKIISNFDLERSSVVKWWLIAGVLGTGAILFVIGWFILFIYFNTCGTVRRNDDEDDYMTQEQRSQLQKGIIINPNPPWTRGVYDHPLGKPWVDPTLIENQQDINNGEKSKKKEPKYKRSFRTLSEARLEKRFKNEEKSLKRSESVKNRKTDNESSTSSSVIMTDTDNDEDGQLKKKREKKKKLSKIEPMITGKHFQDNEMNSQAHQESEIIVENRNEMIETSNEQQLMETELKILRKTKKEKDGLEIKSDFDSDYGSTTNDEETTEKTGKIQEEGEKAEEAKTKRIRPMSAKKQRTSLFNKGDIIQPIEPIPKVWTSYTAGDCVAGFWKNKPSNVYPYPSSPTENGVVEMKSLN